MSSDELSKSETRVVLKRSAAQEFRKLDGSVKGLVGAQLLKIQANPFCGEPLGHKAGINLTGLRKLYVVNRRIRIVWAVKADGTPVVVTIFGIGARDKLEIYRLVSQRWNEEDVPLK